MKTIIDSKGVAFGPFASVISEDDGLLCDDCVKLPYAVLEAYQVVDGARARVYSSDELEDMKDAKAVEIDAARLNANRSKFPHAGLEFACDQLGRSDIDGTNGCITLTGKFPPDWPGGWVALDGTFLPLETVDDWKAFYLSMCSTGAKNFAYSQLLKTQLEQAQTPDEIASITW